MIFDPSLDGAIPARLRDAFQLGAFAAERSLDEGRVPIDELHHAAFMRGRVGAGFERGRGDADLVLLDDPAVLIVGREPDLGEFVDRIIDAFDGFPVDEPFGGDLVCFGPIGVTRNETA